MRIKAGFRRGSNVERRIMKVWTSSELHQNASRTNPPAMYCLYRTYLTYKPVPVFLMSLKASSVGRCWGLHCIAIELIRKCARYTRWWDAPGHLRQGRQVCLRHIASGRYSPANARATAVIQVVLAVGLVKLTAPRSRALCAKLSLFEIISNVNTSVLRCIRSLGLRQPQPV
jgi:hypothetical protein